MNTLNIEAKLAQKYGYKPLPKDLSEKHRQFYAECFILVHMSVQYKINGCDVNEVSL